MTRLSWLSTSSTCVAGCSGVAGEGGQADSVLWKGLQVIALQGRLRRWVGRVDRVDNVDRVDCRQVEQGDSVSRYGAFASMVGARFNLWH